MLNISLYKKNKENFNLMERYNDYFKYFLERFKSDPDAVLKAVIKAEEIRKDKAIRLTDFAMCFILREELLNTAGHAYQEPAMRLG